MNPELLVDVRDVVSNRLLTEPELSRDLLVSKPAGHQLQDLEFTGAHAVERVAAHRSAYHRAKGAARHGSRDGEKAVDGRHQSRDDSVRLRLLQQIAACAAGEGLANLRVGLDAGQDQHLDFGQPADDFARQLDAVHLRKLEIDDGDIRSQRVGETQAFLAVGRLAHDCDSRIVVEQLSEAAPEQGMVVGEEHTHRTVGHRQDQAPAGRGTAQATITPAGRRPRISTLPPSNRARCRMPRVPWPSTRGPGGKPTPSSLILTTSLWSLTANSMFTLCAPAWSATFRRACSTIR